MSFCSALRDVAERAAARTKQDRAHRWRHHGARARHQSCRPGFAMSEGKIVFLSRILNIKKPNFICVIFGISTATHWSLLEGPWAIGLHSGLYFEMQDIPL